MHVINVATMLLVILSKRLKHSTQDNYNGMIDGYYVAYKAITLPCISLMFIEMKFIHYHSCEMFAIKSMSICKG